MDIKGREKPGRLQNGTMQQTKCFSLATKGPRVLDSPWMRYKGIIAESTARQRDIVTALLGGFFLFFKATTRVLVPYKDFGAKSDVNPRKETKVGVK